MVCVYCPGGPDSDFEYSTQSYTGYEPTSMRAIRARYSPYLQTRNRVDQLKRLGHSVEKVGRWRFLVFFALIYFCFLFCFVGGIYYYGRDVHVIARGLSRLFYTKSARCPVWSRFKQW
jgi:hypothetical protein